MVANFDFESSSESFCLECKTFYENFSPYDFDTTGNLGKFALILTYLIFILVFTIAIWILYNKKL